MNALARQSQQAKKGDYCEVIEPAGTSNIRYCALLLFILLQPAVPLSDVTLLSIRRLTPCSRKLFSTPKLSIIKQRDFKILKERLVIIDMLLTERAKDLDRSKREGTDPGDSRRRRAKGEEHPRGRHGSGQADTNRHPAAFDLRFPFQDQSPGQKSIQQAQTVAAHESDVAFLSKLGVISAHDILLQPAVANAENIAQNYFDTTISKLLKKLVPGARSIQQEGMPLQKQIQREVLSEEGKDIAGFSG